MCGDVDFGSFGITGLATTFLLGRGFYHAHKPNRHLLKEGEMKRMVIAAVGAVALMSGAPAAYAAAVFDQTIPVPGEIPAAFVCVDARCIEVEGVENLVIRIQATAAIADQTVLGPTGNNCARVDHQLALNLASSATGEVTVSFFTVDPQTGEKATEPTVKKIFFEREVEGPPSHVIRACVR